jgi:rfaE bifunctional protein nucleotidyltransferase chain/domain
MAKKRANSNYQKDKITKQFPFKEGVSFFGTESNFSYRFVKSYDDIKKLSDMFKRKNLKTVLTQGSFDMIHIGHARYLEAAKASGDILIVGTDSDDKIKKRKGPDRPVVPESERLEMLTHLRPVDIVFLKKEDDPRWHLIKTIRPDVLIATKETYSNEEVKELEKYCGEVKVLEPKAVTSTSAKIRLLQIGFINKLSQALTPKIVNTIEQVFESFIKK